MPQVNTGYRLSAVKGWTVCADNNHVGELSLPGVEHPHKEWPMDRKALVFLSHTSADDMKEKIARPTYWFLKNKLHINAFLDAEDCSPGEDKKRFVMSYAYRCTHALVIISPHFRSRPYCVMELNTFMTRYRKKDGLQIIPVLFGIDHLKEYHPAVRQLIWIRSGQEMNEAEYMAEVVWPQLCKKFPVRNAKKIDCTQCLCEYVETTRGGANEIPNVLVRFCEKNKDRKVGKDNKRRFSTPCFVILLLILSTAGFLAFWFREDIRGLFAGSDDTVPAESPTLSPSSAAPTGVVTNFTLVEVQKIHGNALYHNFGRSVNINSNGTAIVVGGQANNLGSINEMSFAEVYEAGNTTTKDNWELKGSRIWANEDSLIPNWVYISRNAESVVTFVEDYSESVVVSTGGGDVNVVMSFWGLVDVFEFQGSSWKRRVTLSPVNISSSDTKEGPFDIEMVRSSRDGTRFAALLNKPLGYRSNEHFVQVLDMDGRPAAAPIEYDDNGVSDVAVSVDAQTVVVQHGEWTEVFDKQGFYYVQRGSSIQSKCVLVHVTSDGRVVASYDMEVVHFYQFNGTDWEEYSNITSSREYNGFFQFSEDGSTVLITGHARGGGNRPSFLDVFRYIESEWIMVDSLITPTDEFECQLSADGRIIVCGRMYEGFYAFDGDDVGTATIYKLVPEHT